MTPENIQILLWVASTVIGAILLIVAGFVGWLFKSHLNQGARIAALEAVILERRQERESQKSMDGQRWDSIEKMIKSEILHLNDKIEGLEKLINRMALNRYGYDSNRTSGQWATQPQP